MTYRKPQMLTHSHLVNFTMSWPLRYEIEVRWPSRPLEYCWERPQKSPAKSSPIILRRETSKFPPEKTWVVSNHSLGVKSGHLLVEWFCFCWSRRGEERERFPSTGSTVSNSYDLKRAIGHGTGNGDGGRLDLEENGFYTGKSGWWFTQHSLGSLVYRC